MLKILALLTFFGFTAYAQSDTLTASQAKDLIGKEVTVKGIIAGSRLFDKDGKKTFLINLDQKYPDTPLTIALYDDAYKALNLKEADIENKRIVVKGLVVLFKDKPQIVISDVANLKIF